MKKQTLEPMNPLFLELFTVSVLFGIFLVTLHPSITAGDSGEISAAAFSLGMPHPSGYPLYVLVAKSLTLAIPFGNIAYRVNMASAIFGTLSCGMVYLITSKIVGPWLAPAQEGRSQGVPLRLMSHLSPLPALFASFSLAISNELWYRSTVAEVYTLNTFLVLMILYLLLVWREGRFQTRPYGSRLLYLASFLLGLGIGNHHTIVLVVPAALAFILWNRKAEAGTSGHKALQNSSLLAIFFLLGISVYLYLPLRSFQNPFMDWGDPQNARNFIDVFTRKTYLPEKIGRDWGMFANQLRSFNPIHEFTILGIFFSLIGIMWSWKADKRTAALLISTSILTSYGLIILAGSSTEDIGILRKFYLPSYAVFSIFMGIGLASCVKGQGGKEIPKTHESWPLRTIAVYSLAAISLIWQLSFHYPLTQNSSNYLAYDYGMNEMNSLREGSVYISKGEVKTFPLWYLQGVEQYRKDVNVVTAYFLTQRWYLKEVLKNVGVPREIPQDLTYEQMLIYSLYRGNADKGAYTGFLDEEYIPKYLSTYTQGITFQLYKVPEEKVDADVWPKYRLRGIRKVKGDMEKGIVEILKDYASSHYNTGLEYYEKGNSERAINEFEKAIAINPDEPDSLNNLAVLYAGKGVRLKEAETMARKAFELYTGEKDREMAQETIKEIENKMKGSI